MNSKYFCNEFGNNGRGYFHSVSLYNPNYELIECNEQYEYCLNSKKTEFNLDTFFNIAKYAGLKVPFLSHQENQKTASSIMIDEDEDQIVAQALPIEIFENLPPFLKECCDMFTSNQEKSVFLMGKCIPDF